MKRVYEFHPFRLDASEHVLLQNGEPVPLPPKVFETLLILVECRGRIVGKKEMMNRLWPDRFVEESNLTQNIFVLRKALGEGQKAHYIKTIPKRGYRFVAPVEEVQDEMPAPAPAESGAEGAEEKAVPLREGAVKSLAVLPMVNESQDPEVEHLSDGVTESIINGLSQLRQVRVIARCLVSSCKGGEGDALKMGRELGADVVLSSRALVLGGALVISAELVEVATGWRLWGERYSLPLPEMRQAQDGLAVNIVERLRLKLSEEEKGRLGRHYARRPEAYQSYLKGRYYWNKRAAEGYEKAIEYFRQAIEQDPGYAPAYSGLADSYIAFDFYGVLPPWEIVTKAKAAAVNALIIDDTLAEAHTSLGCVKMMYERDWSGAEREFRRAVEFDPDYAHARNWYSHFLMAMGRVEESLAESRRARKLDPLNDSVNQFLGWHYVHARPFDGAICRLEKTVELNPDFLLARATLATAYTQKGEFEKAAEAFRQAQRVYDSPLLLGFLGHVYALKGDREAAVKVLEELEQIQKRAYVPSYCVALIQTALGDKPQALEWFEEAYAGQHERRDHIRVAPEVDSLRSEPQFTDSSGAQT